MAAPFQQSAAVLDLTPRVFTTATVVDSPALAAETIIASVTINKDIQTVRGVLLIGYCAFTVGTAGVTSNLKLRRTDTSGQTVIASGLIPQTAADLVAPSIQGYDVFQAAPGAIYVMTLTIGSGGAVSTVSAVSLVAVVT